MSLERHTTRRSFTRKLFFRSGKRVVIITFHLRLIFGHPQASLQILNRFSSLRGCCWRNIQLEMGNRLQSDGFPKKSVQPRSVWKGVQGRHQKEGWGCKCYDYQHCATFKCDWHIPGIVLKCWNSSDFLESFKQKSLQHYIQHNRSPKQSMWDY